jgi:hypothetical protein
MQERMLTEDKPGWPRFVLVVPLTILLLVVFRFIYPSLAGSMPSCPLLSLTGFQCPGCGGTRAADALVHFRWIDALGNHAWFVLVVLIGLPLIFWMALKEKYPTFPGPQFHQNWLWFCLVSLIIFAVLRSMESFQWLAPDPIKSEN